MLLIVEREFTEQIDKRVQERVTECLKTRIPQEPQDEVAISNLELPQNQPHTGSQMPHTGLPMSPRNLPSALQGPSTPHTIASPVYLAHPSALAHSSNSLDLTSPPPNSSTPSFDANRLDLDTRTSVPGLTIKKAGYIEVSLEILTKSTPTPSPKIEDQLAEQDQYDKVEAADKEKVEAEHEAEVADEIRKLEEAAWLEKERHRKQEEWLGKEVEALESQRLKDEEEERGLKLRQEEEGILKAKQEEKALRLVQERAEEKERNEEQRENQERLSKLSEETRLRLEEDAGAEAKAEANSESEPEEREEVEFEAHKSDGKQDGQIEESKTTSINSPTSDKQRPGPLDLTNAKRSACPVVASLAAARFITDITTVSYPEGCQGPHPDLNQNVKNGKFRYP